MKIKRLQCDVCGGRIMIRAGGQYGECESCGANYTIERIREIYSGMKVSVTGSEDDVEQWKKLVNTYIKAFDYCEAERIVKKILEAVPGDLFANDLYNKLQEYKNMKIENGILIKYAGHAKHIEIPEGVSVIGNRAFYLDLDDFTDVLESVSIPEGVIEIGEMAFTCRKKLKFINMPESIAVIGDHAFASSGIEQINLPSGISNIGSRAFLDCVNLEEIELPTNLEKISNQMFFRCERLRKVTLGEKISFIGEEAFAYTALENINIPYNVQTIENRAFRGCSSLKQKWHKQRICPFCGGTWSAFWGKCKKCGESITEQAYDRVFAE